jgi:hypothetical protein
VDKNRNYMIWEYIKADTFFREYLPHIKSYKHKIRGKNGRGNPCSFTDEDISAINKALKRLVNDLKNDKKFTND